MLEHGPFSLFQEIDELFGPADFGTQHPSSNPTESQPSNSEANDIADWVFLGGPSFREIAVLFGRKISARQLFLRGPHNEDPWALRAELGPEALNSYPAEADDAWMEEGPFEHASI